MQRRTFLAGLSTGLLGTADAADGKGPDEEAPRLQFVYEAHVDIGAVETVGETVQGVQRIIPITGGTFEGPRLKGKIVPGAADWNLLRSDDVSVVSAAYFMRTDDGVIIKILNQGVNGKASPTNPRPLFTSPTFEAPKGKYAWLNQGVFVGSLIPSPPNFVRIRIYRLV
jgi:hypothetical protein